MRTPHATAASCWCRSCAERPSSWPVSYTHLEYDGRKFYCTLSAGYARYPENAITYEDLIKRATYALEYAKAHGKNRCVAFSDDIMKGRTRALELMELLRDSVEHGFEAVSYTHLDVYKRQLPPLTTEELVAMWDAGVENGLSLIHI